MIVLFYMLVFGIFLFINIWFSLIEQIGKSNPVTVSLGFIVNAVAVLVAYLIAGNIFIIGGVALAGLITAEVIAYRTPQFGKIKGRHAR